MVVTSQDMDKYDYFVKQAVPKYLLHLADSFLKIANFSRHRVKHIKANTLKTQKVIDDSQLIKTQTPALPEMPHLVNRPSTDQLQEEIQRGARKDLSFEEEDPDSGCQRKLLNSGRSIKKMMFILKPPMYTLVIFGENPNKRVLIFTATRRPEIGAEFKESKYQNSPYQALEGKCGMYRGDI